jgi:hypothetical protein
LYIYFCLGTFFFLLLCRRTGGYNLRLASKKFQSLKKKFFLHFSYAGKKKTRSPHGK